jgi:cytochrome b involved in lipid metabolism
MNQKLVIIIGVLVLSLGLYFGLQAYQQNQEIALEQELEVLKNTPEAEKCLVTIRGDQYDLTTFASKHPGGNIFKCGEDMTEAFNKKHGQNQLNEIQKYKVVTQ